MKYKKGGEKRNNNGDMNVDLRVHVWDDQKLSFIYMNINIMTQTPL